MNRLLAVSLLLMGIAGTWAAGCSSSKTPAAGGSAATGGNSNGSGGAPAAGGSAGQDSGTQPDAATGDTSLHSYDADDPNLVYVGRIDFSDPKAPRYSAPGVYVTANFAGVSVSVKVQAVTSAVNYFDLVIDGDDANATEVETSSNTGWINVVPNLPYGEHTATLVKRTESSPGPVEFQGFEFAGTILPPPAAKPHKIEIIGDSISVGSGNLAAKNTTQCNDINAYSNANLAFGPVLARQLNADYHITAHGGIGVIRTDPCGSNTISQVYDRLYLEQSSSPDSGTNVWDTAEFKPDAILIELGTNDFKPTSCNYPPLNETYDPTNYALFISTLENFIGTLRGYYGDVNGGTGPDFFLMSSPMITDGYPNSTYTSDTDQRAAITTVANDLNGNTTGNGKVHLSLLTAAQDDAIADLGCGGHPRVGDHAKIAADMLPLVQSSMGW